MSNLQKIKTLKKKLKKETKFRKQEISRKLAQLEGEHLDAMGVPEEAEGIENVKQIEGEYDKEDQRLRWRDVDYLDSVKDWPNRYRDRLLNVMTRLVSQEAEDREIPKDFSVHIWISEEKGICLAFKLPDGRVFNRGFKPSYIPKYDQRACFTFVFDMIVEMQNWLRFSIKKSGFILPDNAPGPTKIYTPHDK